MQHGRRSRPRLFGTRPISRKPLTRIGITGTDTGVGKTVVASAIVAALRKSGLRVAPMKPVETGSGEDAEILRAAAGNVHPLTLIRPYAYPDPIAPLVAARRARRPIDIEVLDRAFRALEASSDAVVVEGAGGLMVPFTETHAVADLFKLWELDVVIVAANKLGVVNHTLLTVDCARAYGLTVRAVVLNTVSTDRSDLATRTNEALLKELLLTVPVVSFPYTQTPLDFLQLAGFARDFSTQTIRRS